MIDKVANDARIYTDIQSLENLRYKVKSNPESVRKEMARQFEAMFMQLVMRSMRDANNALSSGLFGDSSQMEMYQDMFDKQLTLVTSSSGNSFASMIEKNLEQQYGLGGKDRKAGPAIQPGKPPVTAATAAPKEGHAFAFWYLLPLHDKPITTEVKNAAAQTMPAPVTNRPEAAKENLPPEPSMFSSPEEFVKSLWSYAKHAAGMLGADPRILLAQAALETNWGKKILTGGNNSTHNLFNIKADNAWTKETASVDTLEQKNGILSKERASFRSYSSYMDSFTDYVNFLKSNSRYMEALDKAANPSQFVHALQKAGFATDREYADKILKIFSSPTFRHMVEKLE